MEDLIQSSIAFPVRKRSTPSRRKIATNPDEEKENSPTKKIQIETPRQRRSTVRKSLKLSDSSKLEFESILNDFTTKQSKPKTVKSKNSEKSSVANHPPIAESTSSTTPNKITQNPPSTKVTTQTTSSNQEAAKVPSGINYKKTKQALHTSIPDWLVGRKAESEEINNFITEHVEQNTPGSIYISGAPGTGKTAVLMKTIEALKHPCIKVVINCMTHKNSQSIFNAIRLNLSEEGSMKVSSASSKDAINDVEDFITSSQMPIIMVFDEIDSLDSRNQEVLYTIFEWPALEGSKLVLVGVANSLDLTDRILPRLQSRKKCKPHVLNFPPYSMDEIANIILERLAKLGCESALDPMSVHFCARKLSSMSGDLRMALDVCRRSVDVVEMDERKNNNNDGPARGAKKVGLSVIQKVINEVYGQKITVKNESRMKIPLQQMLAVCTLLIMSKNKQTSKEVNFVKFHENYVKICSKNGVAGIERSEFLSLCTSIEDQGLVAIKKAKEVRLYKVSLRVNEKELETAIQDKTLLSSILSKGLE